MNVNQDTKIAYYFHIHGKDAIHGIESPVSLFMDYPELMGQLLNKPTLHCGDIKAKFGISHNDFSIIILSDSQDREATAMIDELVAVSIEPKKITPQEWRERIDTLVDTLQIDAAKNWEHIKKFHSFHCENDASGY